MSLQRPNQSRFSMPTTIVNHHGLWTHPPVRGSVVRRSKPKTESHAVTGQVKCKNPLAGYPGLMVPLRSLCCRPYSVAHLGGWRTLRFSGCGFFRISPSRKNRLRVGHVFFRVGLVDFKKWSRRGICGQGAAVGGPLGLAAVEARAARAAASCESRSSRSRRRGPRGSWKLGGAELVLP